MCVGGGGDECGCLLRWVVGMVEATDMMTRRQRVHIGMAWQRA